MIPRTELHSIDAIYPDPVGLARTGRCRLPWKMQTSFESLERGERCSFAIFATPAEWLPPSICRPEELVRPPPAAKALHSQAAEIRGSGSI